MQLKYSKGKRKKVQTFSVGDHVSVRIPRIDRSSTDSHRLLCVIVERLGETCHLYRLKCQFGVLKTCYGEGDLECYEGNLGLTLGEWSALPRISLREAALNSNPQNDFVASRCHCKTACTSNLCACKKRGAPCTSKCHSGSQCQNQEDTQTTKPAQGASKKAKRPRKQQFWIPALDLRILDKDIIEKGGLLCDRHMYATNKLLSSQFPAIQGMQSTLLSQTDGFTPVTSDAVQIHFVNENHWVASSFMNGFISLYDSLSSGTISAGLEIQLARIYGHLEGSIEDGGLTIHHVSVQKQEGTKDCGVYAIAFAYHAALGENLEEITFDKDKLRSHLVTCFQNNCLSKFPICSQKSARACKPSVSFVRLYCDCKVPESFDNVVACDGCDKWFHYKCVNFPARHIGDWFCNHCQ